ncbi:MAG: ANTAR domain-containing protein [Geodermatophilaceae bacterium]|nr:ANTAR domain-containing protein [Geodermatophilaceae bacterium]MDQ3455264.1 ANTAR domain-containing protein [Actinomycetota bacterium]
MEAYDVLDDAPESVLCRLVDRVAASVPGCCGATFTSWTTTEEGLLPIVRVCSHPDLAELEDLDILPTESPLVAAAVSGEPAWVGDTLRDTRFPAFSIAALRLGVRSVVCSVESGRVPTATLSLYSVRPDLSPGHTAGVAAALLREAISAAGRTLASERSRREVHHLTQAMAVRSVIEQAKGMIMQAVKCDAATAFQHLSSTAQRSRRRLADVARDVVRTHEAAPRS